MYLIQMFGTICQILRYQIIPKDETITYGIYAVTEEEANELATRYEGTIQETDHASYEWLDGMEFETREDAIAAYEMGEEAYKAKQSQPSDHDLLMTLLGNSSDPQLAAQNLGNVLQVMAAQLFTSEL